MSTGLTFSLADRCHVSLYAVVLSATATYAYTSRDASPLVLAGAACAVAWLVTGMAFGRRGWMPFLSRLLPNLAVLAAAVFMALRVYLYFNGTRNFIMELDGFLVILAVCKLFEGTSVRNIAQVLTLSLLLVVSTTMFSNSSLVYFVLLGVFFTWLFYSVMALNLLIETQAQATVQAEAAGAEPLAKSPRSGGRRLTTAALGRDLANVVRHSLFLVLPVAVAVFTLVPRTRANPMLGNSWDAGPVQTGYSETVQFRDQELLTPSDVEVMHVKIFRGETDVGAEFSDLYFRGAVLNEYDDGTKTWSRAPLGPGMLAASAAQNPFNMYPFYEPEIRVSFAVNHPGPVLFVLAPFAPALNYTRQGLFYDPNDMTLHYGYGGNTGQGPLSYSGGWLRDVDPEIPAIADSAHARFDFTGSWMQRLLKPDLRPRCYCPAGQLRHWRLDYNAYGHVLRDRHGNLQFKESVQVPPAVRQMAYAILADDMGDEAPRPGQLVPLEQFARVANIFCTYLRQNYRYALSSFASDPHMDFTADFLLHRGIRDDNTGGPCTYFASSMVMLCRSVGMNARMVTGYHGGEYNSYSSEFVVKEKHAHAWAEIYMPSQGWRLYDATPVGATLDAAGTSGHFLSDVMQMLQSVWSALIVNFDNDSRAALVRWLASWWDALLDQIQYPEWTPLALGAALAGLLTLQILLRRRIHRRERLWKQTPGLTPRRARRRAERVGFLDELLGLFEHGAARRPDQTPLEFLGPHLDRLGPAAADACWLVNTAYGVRFGDLPMNSPLRQRVARALKNVKSALRPLAHARSV